MNWGYLREHSSKIINDAIDPDTGINRTGLDEYLAFIFPKNEWIHDKAIPADKRKNRNIPAIRPDYRCESLNLIVEFDGFPHYKDPKTIAKDFQNEDYYKILGYKVVRIPYFIQLTNDVVFQLFGIKITENLFDPSIPSLTENNEGNPAYLCPSGLERMARDFKKFPQQYQVNYNSLENVKNDALTGLSYLQREMERLTN